jgi:hypothetical protein
MPKKEQSADKPQVLGFIGVGLDNKDGHQRVTQADHFVLLGGSAETHEQMQDVAIHFNESLEKRGKRLEEAEPREALDLLREALDR